VSCCWKSDGEFCCRISRLRRVRLSAMYLAAFAAIAPAAAAMANHFAARAILRKDGTSFGGAHGIIPFPAEGLGLQLFVGYVGLGGSQFRLAGFAVRGEVVERH
jgi:hypothetical protein